MPNETFDYYITLNNNNSVSASILNVTDQLPENFTLSQVKLKIGSGPNNTLSSSDYNLNRTNLFEVPSSSGPTITVPANSSSLITLTGYFN